MYPSFISNKKSVRLEDAPVRLLIPEAITFGNCHNHEIVLLLSGKLVAFGALIQSF